MIAVDTNILARFYCDDPDDPEGKRQRPLARRVMIESPAVFVPLSVILEFEWVMRGFYEAEPESFCDAVEHLLGMPHVTVERWEVVKDALDLHRRGFDFADALHWKCSAACERLVIDTCVSNVLSFRSEVCDETDWKSGRIGTTSPARCSAA